METILHTLVIKLLQILNNPTSTRYLISFFIKHISKEINFLIKELVELFFFFKYLMNDMVS